MLTFLCTDCRMTISVADDEDADRIFERLEEHITKCPLAMFTFTGTTSVAQKRVEILRSVIEQRRAAGKILLQ
jgi:hypothetical protein